MDKDKIFEIIKPFFNATQLNDDNKWEVVIDICGLIDKIDEVFEPKRICDTCKHYWKTQLVQYDIHDFEMKNPIPLYTCHLADDWTEPNDECIIDNWESKYGI